MRVTFTSVPSTAIKMSFPSRNMSFVTHFRVYISFFFQKNNSCNRFFQRLVRKKLLLDRYLHQVQITESDDTARIVNKFLFFGALNMLTGRFGLGLESRAAEI